MNYTKILMSASMIAFVVTLVFGGTQAFFSDEEKSTGNTFSAGAIDLLIDNSSYGFDWNDPEVTDPTGEWGPNENNSWQLSDLTNQLFFSFVDLKPGDYGEDTISLHVNDNDAYACMAFDLTGTPENGQNEPEAEVDATAGADEGELQNYLSFLFWHDDGDNVYETGEVLIEELSGLPGSIFSGDWLPIAEAGDEPLTGDTTHYIGKGWCFGEMEATPVTPGDYGAPTATTTGFTCNGAGNHNDAQTDGIVVDVAFHAVQSRHNDGFLCSSLPPLDGESDPEPVRPSVGAVLGAYSAPSCNATVSNNESIQDALKNAPENSTVCVADDYTGIGDNAALRMETNGVTLAALTRGTALGVPVVLSADGVTVTGFTGSIGQAEGASEIAAFYLDNDATNATLSFSTVTGDNTAPAVVTESGADNSGSMIVNNVFMSSYPAIYTNPHTGIITIENNDFIDNLVGIGNLNGALVQNNEFDHSNDAMEAIGAGTGTFGDYDGSTIQFNNFLGGTRINAYPDPAITVDAPNNFFGPNGAAAQTTADVDTTPAEGSAFPHN